MAALLVAASFAAAISGAAGFAGALLPLPLLVAMGVVTRAIGGALLLFVAMRCSGVLRITGGTVVLIGGGGLVGFLSGLVGSAGPLGAAIFLSLGLPPVAYIASEATTALVMHAVKTLVYQPFVPLDHEFWIFAALMGAAMILGTWAAKRAIERMPRQAFQRFVATLLVVVAAYMVVHG